MKGEKPDPSGANAILNLPAMVAGSTRPSSPASFHGDLARPVRIWPRSWAEIVVRRSSAAPGNRTAACDVQRSCAYSRSVSARLKRPSGHATEAEAAKAKRHRRLTWAFAVIWASDWLFAWTERLGVGELGAWLWLLGLGLLVYRSVVGTRLPEWLLTWLWMLAVLGLWIGEISLIGDLALHADTPSDPGFIDELGGAPWSRRVDKTADVLSTTLAAGMLGWAVGLLEVLLAGVYLSLAFVSRRRRLAAEHGDPDPPPQLHPRERAAHATLVALQSPVFALLLVVGVAILSAGIVLWQGTEVLPAEERELAGEIARTFVLAGLAGFVLAVLELRQLQSLRWCGRVRLVLAGLVAIGVLGALVAFAVFGHPLGWVIVGVALFWCFAQISAVRILWGVGRRNLI
jgi:hypothetical protein